MCVCVCVWLCVWLCDICGSDAAGFSTYTYYQLYSYFKVVDQFCIIVQPSITNAVPFGGVVNISLQRSQELL